MKRNHPIYIVRTAAGSIKKRTGQIWGWIADTWDKGSQLVIPDKITPLLTSHLFSRASTNQEALSSQRLEIKKLGTAHQVLPFILRRELPYKLKVDFNIPAILRNTLALPFAQTTVLATDQGKCWGISQECIASLRKNGTALGYSIADLTRLTGTLGANPPFAAFTHHRDWSAFGAHQSLNTTHKFQARAALTLKDAKVFVRETTATPLPPPPPTISSILLKATTAGSASIIMNNLSYEINPASEARSFRLTYLVNNNKFQAEDNEAAIRNYFQDLRYVYLDKIVKELVTRAKACHSGNLNFHIANTDWGNTQHVVPILRLEQGFLVLEPNTGFHYCQNETILQKYLLAALQSHYNLLKENWSISGTSETIVTEPTDTYLSKAYEFLTSPKILRAGLGVGLVLVGASLWIQAEWLVLTAAIFWLALSFAWAESHDQLFHAFFQKPLAPQSTAPEEPALLSELHRGLFHQYRGIDVEMPTSSLTTLLHKTFPGKLRPIFSHDDSKVHYVIDAPTPKPAP